MKILKIILVILTLLVVVFFALGLMNPTISYSTEIVVDKPLEESWAVFSDDDKLPLWIDGLKDIELLSGTKDEVGAVHKITMEHEGDTMVMIETLKGYKEMEQYDMEFDTDAMVQNVQVRFSAVDDNTTRITETATVAGKGIFMRSLFTLMQGTFPEYSQNMYDRLKILIEENTKDYYPEQEMETDLTE